MTTASHTFEMREERRSIARMCRRLGAGRLLRLVELFAKLVAALLELLAIWRAPWVEAQDGNSDLSKHFLILHVEKPVPGRPSGQRNLNIKVSRRLALLNLTTQTQKHNVVHCKTMYSYEHILGVVEQPDKCTHRRCSQAESARTRLCGSCRSCSSCAEKTWSAPTL